MAKRVKLERCDKCRKAVDNFYGKGYYGGNKDENMYCLKCYSKVFNEDFFDSIPKEVLDKMEKDNE